MRVLVTRPAPDAERQAETLAARGHRPIVAPLLRFRLIENEALPLGGVGALVVTSRNALRAVAHRSEAKKLRALRLFAVGQGTATTAAEQGFTDVIEGPGTADALAAFIARMHHAASGDLLHLSGEELSLDMSRELAACGLSVRRAIVYGMDAVETLTPEAQDALASGAAHGVLLMSVRTARVYGDLVTRAGLAARARRVSCFCLSRSVADAVSGLAPIAVAARPNEDALLALLDGAPKL